MDELITFEHNSNNTKMNTAPTGTATLLGGTDYEVTKLDGTKEKVKVRQLSIRQFPEYLNALDNEPDTIELLCDKPKGWSDLLTAECQEQIILVGESVNSDFFSRWVRRRAARSEMLMPGLAEKIAARVSNSTTMLPSSPSKPGSASQAP